MANEVQVFKFVPQNYEQAWKFAEDLANSSLVPKGFQNEPANCLIAMQWGAEIGMGPLQAIQNIAPINGRPTLWGDAMIALVRSSPLCEYVREEDDGVTAICRVKRRGDIEQIRTFSVDDAKLAGLLGKSGPWTQYPKRMRQMRARAFALRDVFADVLRGIGMAEEVMDIPAERHMGDIEIVQPPQQKAAAAPLAIEYMPQEAFTAILSRLTPRIAENGDYDGAIVWANNRGKGRISVAQEAEIRAIKVIKKEPLDIQAFSDKIEACKTVGEVNQLQDGLRGVDIPADQIDLIDSCIARRIADLSK